MFFNVNLLTLFAIAITECWCVGEKAAAKCKEYAKYVYADEASPAMTPEKGTETVSKCSINETPLIVGGSKVSEREFPHMALIGFGKNAGQTNLEWSCGGSIISELFILSAGHCVKSQQGDAKKVRVGVDEIDSTMSSQEIVIEQAITHPEYAAQTKYNDIALFKLTETIKFDSNIRPACLNTNAQLNWQKAIAIGFGKLHYENTETSKHLMKVQLSNIEKEFCKNVYDENKLMTKGVIESQFCAGEKEGKKDTCQGDSGGPLQTVLADPHCMYNIIGVTSFGKFCGFENSPGLYTRVASYIGWIEDNVWK